MTGPRGSGGGRVVPRRGYRDRRPDEPRRGETHGRLANRGLRLSLPDAF